MKAVTQSRSEKKAFSKFRQNTQKTPTKPQLEACNLTKKCDTCKTRYLHS